MAKVSSGNIDICLSARIEEFLWTIPHALNGRSKFDRTLMYMSPVTSLILTSLFVLNNSVLITFHTRRFACEQSVADVQQARRFFNPCLSRHMLKIFSPSFMSGCLEPFSLALDTIPTSYQLNASRACRLSTHIPHLRIREYGNVPQTH